MYSEILFGINIAYLFLKKAVDKKKAFWYFT